MNAHRINTLLKGAALLLLLLSMTLSTAHAKKLALVVGNNAYTNGRLERPEADAKAVKTSLESLGYSVTLGLNTTKPQFDTLLSQFKRQIEAGDDVILFFSGHGIDLPLRGNVLLGVFDMSQELDDYDLLKQAGIVVSDTLSELAERKPRMVLALLDACRTFMRRTGTKSLGSQTLSRQEPPTGQMVLYASKHGEPSWDLVDHSDKHTLSPFTRVLVQELTRPNQPLSFLEQRVRTGVQALFDAAAPDPRLGNKRRTQTPMGFSTLVGDPSYSLNQVVPITTASIPSVVSSPVPLTSTPAIVKANYAADTFFEVNSSVVNAASKAKIDAIVEKAKGIDLEVVIAVGHASKAEGSTAQNLRLSVLRAVTIKSYMVGLGFPANRVYTEGKGDKQLVADERTTEGKSRNRRVEIGIFGTRTN
jgi:OmpA-OmpF porin, OOP family